MPPYTAPPASPFLAATPSLVVVEGGHAVDAIGRTVANVLMGLFGLSIGVGSCTAAN